MAPTVSRPPRRPGRRPGPDGHAELVFCRLKSNEDVFPLARYVASASHRVVPLVMADLLGAPWSAPSRRPAGVLQPVVFLTGARLHHAAAMEGRSVDR